jgi:hypothetical protein
MENDITIRLRKEISELKKALQSKTRVLNYCEQKLAHLQFRYERLLEDYENDIGNSYVEWTDDYMDMGEAVTEFLINVPYNLLSKKEKSWWINAAVNSSSINGG